MREDIESTDIEEPADAVSSSAPSGDPIAAEPLTEHPLRATIEEWFVRHFHGLGPNMTEYMHARIHAAKEELLTLLIK